MTTSFPTSPVAALEQQRLAVAQEQGFALFFIRPEGSTPGFIYSVGMAQHQLPELLCFFPGDESVGAGTANVVAEVCRRLIAGVQRFDRITLLRAFLSQPLRATDPCVEYQLSLLRGEDFAHALQGYLTRSVLFREELGVTQGVVLMQHPEVPSFQQIRAQRMLAIS